MNARKVVQISVIPEGEAFNGGMIVLCDDGTMWQSHDNGKAWLPWQRIPPVPSDDGDNA